MPADGSHAPSKMIYVSNTFANLNTFDNIQESPIRENPVANFSPRDLVFSKGSTSHKDIIEVNKAGNAICVME
jgi:hypothetical protein